MSVPIRFGPLFTVSGQLSCVQLVEHMPDGNHTMEQVTTGVVVQQVDLLVFEPKRQVAFLGKK